ncbi:MAG TPA: hypothetical protein VF139_07160 [Candidatus Polarisedimenticolaceae bacterium]
MLFYRIAFLLPGIAAAVSLLLAMQAGILRRPVIVIAIFALGALCQGIGGMFSPTWATGLALQTALAIYLQIKLRLDG